MPLAALTGPGDGAPQRASSSPREGPAAAPSGVPGSPDFKSGLAAALSFGVVDARGSMAPIVAARFPCPEICPQLGKSRLDQIEQLDGIELNRSRPASDIALVMKGSPVQVRASALVLVSPWR